MEEKNYYAKNICGIAFLLSAIVYGTIIFVKAEQIDFYTCLFFFKTILPYCIVIAWLGYLIGKIIDSSMKKGTKREQKGKRNK